MILTFAQIPMWTVSLLTVFFLIVCLSMILIVLIQRPQGGGLSGAFGAGGGSGQTAFGTKTGDVLTLVTIGIFILFLGTAIGLNFAVRPPSAGPSVSSVVSPDAPGSEQAADKQAESVGDGVSAQPEPAEGESETEGSLPGDEVPTDPSPGSVPAPTGENDSP